MLLPYLFLASATYSALFSLEKRNIQKKALAQINENTNLDTLLDDLKSLIFKFLGAHDLANLCVSSKWRQIILRYIAKREDLITLKSRYVEERMRVVCPCQINFQCRVACIHTLFQRRFFQAFWRKARKLDTAGTSYLLLRILPSCDASFFVYIVSDQWDALTVDVGKAILKSFDIEIWRFFLAHTPHLSTENYELIIQALYVRSNVEAFRELVRQHEGYPFLSV